MNKEKEMKNGVVDRISKNKKQLIGKEISKGGTSKNSKGKNWNVLISCSTVVLQATCVDSIIPYKQHRMNLSYGCYGCRDATDIGPDESVLGFPYSDFDGVVEYIEYLSMKAIPNSRNKNAYTILKKRGAEKVLKTDIFQMHQREK